MKLKKDNGLFYVNIDQYFINKQGRQEGKREIFLFFWSERG